jgi:hypothetical protein
MFHEILSLICERPVPGDRVVVIQKEITYEKSVVDRWSVTCCGSLRRT